MRDFVAVLIVFLLVAFALRMATSLQWYKRGQSKIRRTITASGQSIIAEIPGTDGLEFFTEDTRAFHWKKHIIQKEEIRSTRLLISGAPISVRVSQLLPDPTPLAKGLCGQGGARSRVREIRLALGTRCVVAEHA